MELGQGTSRAQQLIKESRLVVDGLPEYTVNDGVACDRNEEEVGRVHELLHKSDRELYQEKYTEFVPFNGKRDNRSCTTTLWLEPSRRK